VPVVSGNVSLYNETKDESIYPTPVVGMVGLIENVTRHCSMGFRNEGDSAFLLGYNRIPDSCLGGSEYLELIHGIVKGNPSIDLEFEKRLQQCCLEAIGRGIVSSAHDCSEGGLLVCLAESCVAGGLGLVVQGWRIEDRLDTALFGEAQSRIVISVKNKHIERLEKIAWKWQVPVTKLGIVGGKRLIWEDYLNITLERMENAWMNGLNK